MRQYTDIILPKAKEVINLNNIPPYEFDDWDLTDYKELNKFFFTIEKICRGSNTYKKLINFLRENVDMNKCSFYKNSSNIDTSSIHIHIHHEPFTLYDIVNIVYNKRYMNHEVLTENQIAKEVMYNHYRMVVGLIPLSETVHEIVHNGFLFIPTNKVFGYYKQFVKEYHDYIDQQLLKTLEKNEQISEQYEFDKATKVLDVNTIYVDTTGTYELPKMEDIINTLKTKMDDYDKQLLVKQLL